MACVLAVVVATALGPAAATQAAAGPGVSRVLLTPTANPATSQYVSWSRSSALSGQRVEVRAAGGPVRAFTARRKLGTTKRTAGRTQYRYVATATDLRAATAYAYRIVTRRGATPWRSFTTAGPASAPVTFLEFGDTQIKNAGVPEAIIDAATRRYPQARLLLHAGDVVNHPWVDREWSDLHRALSPSGQSKNWMIAMGNHEQCVLLTHCRSGDGRGFRSYVQGAGNGFAQQRRTWYWSDQGPVRFIVLDSFGRDLARQRDFLRTALATNTRPWTVVLMHAGPFASRGDRTNTAMRRWFLPAFEQYGVDLVLSGHDHSYARGHKAGVTYLTSVSGPKFYSSSAADWTRGGATRVVAAARTATYQAITATPQSLTVESIVGYRGSGSTATASAGQVLDRFTLTP